MSRQINQPINQVRLTNVAVVRMNKGGKRFEIACYRNKVVNYRQGLEQDLSEVLQTDRIFTNVSKGEFAKAKDLLKVFQTKDEEEIAKIILTKGQMQVSDKERNQQLEKTNAQIAEWISQNCVHPTSDRPYTNPQIRHAMQQANFSVHPTKPLKRQYLDCVKVLQTVIPIVRAKMELKLFVPAGNDAVDDDDVDKQQQQNHIRVEEAMKSNNVTWEDESLKNDNDDGDDDRHHKYRILVDPSLYRILNEVMQTIDGARIEIVNQVATKQGDVSLETEMPEGIINHHHDQNNALPLEQKVANLDLGEKDKPENNNKNDDLDDDDDDDDCEMAMASHRKQQKKSKKKNKKQQRRAAENNKDTNNSVMEDTSTAISQQQQQQPITTTTEASNNLNPSSSTTTRKSCNTCGGSFDTAAEYRSHFKSDWHKFNQKLKLKGAAPISEQEFLLCDSDTFFNNNDKDDL